MANNYRVMYVPKEFVVEMDEIQKELGLKKKADCFRLIAKSSRLGRDLKKMFK